MKIAIVEPFFSGSHRQWAESLQAHSQHTISIFSLPGRHWKWRMNGAAIGLAEEINQATDSFDLIIASDMLHLPLFKSLLSADKQNIPIVLYFHENQLTYPWSPNDADVELQRDRHYAFTNYTSALVADYCFFNSAYHKNSFLSALPVFLKAFPDKRNTWTVEKITQKSSVLHLGLDLKKFDVFADKTVNKIPIILWNHRWEYDKNPEEFFSILRRLKREGKEFQLVLLGERYKKQPAIFEEAIVEFEDEILYAEYASSFAQYAYWLWRADILPVTSQQDFFGISTIEAIYCQCYPLLPNRLAFPEHLSENDQVFLYENKEEFYKKMNELLNNWKNNSYHLPSVQRYDWLEIIDSYDEAFNKCIP